MAAFADEYLVSGSVGATAQVSKLSISAQWLTGAALAFLALGLASRFIALPWLERLAPYYGAELKYDAECRFRDSPTAVWQDFHSIVTRRDQTLLTSEGVSLIQAQMLVFTEYGELSYASSGLFGVDPTSRANITGYGDKPRKGQFLLPPNMKDRQFQLWDPYYSGPVSARYARSDVIDGLVVDVFDIQAENLDDTDGYGFLPKVPEEYHVRSDGVGQISIEPRTGIAVESTHEGISTFVGAQSGAAVGDMYHWRTMYTPETRAEQVVAARRMRAQMAALDGWGPLTCVVGAAAFGIASGRNRRSRAFSSPAGVSEEAR